MNIIGQALLDGPAQSLVVPRAKGARVVGYDVARAVAIFSMLIDHCGQVFGIGHGSAFLTAYELIDGRASAIFVLLAGVGVSLLGRKRSPAELRQTLVRRGALLLAIGLLNQMVWPGDILRVFGVAIILAGFLTALSSRWLLLLAAALVAAFPAMMLFFGYYDHWDADMTHYRGLWTPIGMLRNLFFDGYRPVIPWAALLIFGMWLGRLDVSQPRVPWLILGWGLILLIGAELGSRAALNWALIHQPAWDQATLRDWLEISSTPPLPPFVFSVMGSALIVVALCLMAGVRFAECAPLRAMVATGQMALTWYIAHISVLALIVHWRGWSQGESGLRALSIGLTAFGTMLALSLWWKRRWNVGPMEWLLRRVG